MTATATALPLRGAVKACHPWTASDRERLLSVYARGGMAAATRAFPTRTPSSLYHVAGRGGPLRRRRWTAAEDARLRLLWGSVSLRTICRTFRRPRGGIMWHAVQVLGLPSGCPDGLEYLSHAARRTGYGSGQLRRILGWAGVRLAEAYTYLVRGRQRHVVDPFDVDDALERWHQTETIQGAARRLGACAETLQAALAKAGVTPTKADPSRKKSHYRVRSEDVDRAWGERTNR